jgi:hypothetical protein
VFDKSGGKVKVLSGLSMKQIRAEEKLFGLLHKNFIEILNSGIFVSPENKNLHGSYFVVTVL